MTQVITACCGKCESLNLYLLRKPDRTGLYCASCGSWQTWVGKKNITTYLQKGYKISDTPIQTDYGTRQKEVSEIYGMDNTSKATKETHEKHSIVLEERCTSCGHNLKETAEIRQKGSHTGLYCSNCSSWIKWVSKKERPLLKSLIKGVESTENEDSDLPFTPVNNQERDSDFADEYSYNPNGSFSSIENIPKPSKNNQQKEEICSTCVTSILKCDSEDIEASIYKKEDTMIVLRNQDFNVIGSINIKYCPTCGKKLV